MAVASYADDTTPYIANKTNDLVIKEIEHFSEVLFKWLDFNYMKINSGKSHNKGLNNSRGLNNKINSLHERALRVTYDDRSSSFEDLLKKDNSVFIDHRNIQALVTEMFKVKNKPEIMKELFAPKISHYDLCNNNSFKSRRVNSVWHGTESVSYLGPKIWDLVPNEIKESESLNSFKFKIKR